MIKFVSRISLSCLDFNSKKKNMKSQPVRKKAHTFFLNCSFQWIFSIFTQIALGKIVIQFDDPSRKVVNLNCHYRWNWPRFMVKGLGARQRSMRPQLQRDPHDFLGLKVAGLCSFFCWKTLGERIVMIIMIIAIIMILIIIIMMLAIMRLRKYIYIYFI